MSALQKFKTRCKQLEDEIVLLKEALDNATKERDDMWAHLVAGKPFESKEPIPFHIKVRAMTLHGISPIEALQALQNEESMSKFFDSLGEIHDVVLDGVNSFYPDSQNSQTKS